MGNTIDDEPEAPPVTDRTHARILRAAAWAERQPADADIRYADTAPVLREIAAAHASGASPVHLPAVDEDAEERAPWSSVVRHLRAVGVDVWERVPAPPVQPEEPDEEEP